jgi:hypothetical protein
MWIVSLCRSRLVAVIAEAASRHGTASQVKVSTRLLLRGLRRVPTINLSHDFFSPPDRILDCAHGRRNTLSAFVLCQLPCRENARCDQQHGAHAVVLRRLMRGAASYATGA